MGLCAAETTFLPKTDQTEKGQEEQSDSSESIDSTSKVIHIEGTVYQYNIFI